MKSILIQAVAAVGLFAGALVGMLAATGRLNHEGTQTIPLIGSLFPPPDETDDATNGHEAEAGAEGVGAEAPLTGAEDATGAEVVDRESDTARPPRLRAGRSVLEPAPPTGAEGGGGHGTPEEDNGSSHEPPAAETAHSEQEKPKSDAGRAANAQTARNERRHRTGDYFRFDGMPAGITQEQINDAWRRVQDERETLAQRANALDLREKELLAIEGDVQRRQADLGKLMNTLEAMQRELDNRIDQFHREVEVIRSDEVASLKRNAQILASFEPSKTAELIQESWKTETEQERILKTMELMDRDAANSILSELPNALIRDVLEKRLKVTRERSEEAQK